MTLVVYFVIRKTRGLGGQDTAEILVQLKETNRLLDQFIAAQKEQ